MDNPSNTSNNSDNKNRKTPTQLQTIFYYLKTYVATASMVAAATGVPQKCITRYKRDLEKRGLLWEVEKKMCQETSFKAWYLTTNPDDAPTDNQINIFTV